MPTLARFSHFPDKLGHQKQTWPPKINLATTTVAAFLKCSHLTFAIQAWKETNLDCVTWRQKEDQLIIKQLISTQAEIAPSIILERLVYTRFRLLFLMFFFAMKAIYVIEIFPSSLSKDLNCAHSAIRRLSQRIQKARRCIFDLEKPCDPAKDY